jgi:hypothetical protein
MNLAPYAVKDMTSGKPFQEGTYRIRIHGFEFNDVHDAAWKAAHQNSQAKDPYLQVETVILDENSENGEVVLGRHLYTTLTFKKGGDFMLRQLCEAAGMDEEWMLVDDQGEPHWDELKDVELMAVVTIQPERTVGAQTYQARNEVKKFIASV